jgi:transcriptional regulator with XRE-family HTH domain
MFQDLGKLVRDLRQKKGISLNAFAEQLGVSSAYLSNLETGKTDNVQLKLLHKLQEELTVFPLQTNSSSFVEQRLVQLAPKLADLAKSNPTLANFLLDTLERGLRLG